MNIILERAFFCDSFLNFICTDACSCCSLIFLCCIIFQWIFIQWINISLLSYRRPFGLILIFFFPLRTFCKYCLRHMCKCYVLKSGIVDHNICYCLLLLENTELFFFLVFGIYSGTLGLADWQNSDFCKNHPISIY